MTPERFGELLRRPHLLDGQNAIELEELIAAHPWCGPLRVLRYRKAVVARAEDVDHWRARAEPSLPRGAVRVAEADLQDANTARARQHFSFGGSEANPEHQPVPTPELVPAARLHTADDGLSKETLSDIVAAGAALIGHTVGRALATSPAPGTRTAPRELSDCILTAAAAVDTVDWLLHRNGHLMELGHPNPTPIEQLDSYKRWKRRRVSSSWDELLRLGIDTDEAPKRKKKDKKPPSPSPATPEVASETLAELLAAQGHHERAVEMYEQLSLRYPAKSATFAARIAALPTTDV